MTRGRRNNPITLPGKRSEPTRQFSQVVLFSLARKRKITVNMFRAADQLYRDFIESQLPLAIIEEPHVFKAKLARKRLEAPQRVLTVSERLAPRHRRIIADVVLKGLTPVDYGRAITGSRNDRVCTDHAMAALKATLRDLDDIYMGYHMGVKGAEAAIGYDDLALTIDVRIDRE